MSGMQLNAGLAMPFDTIVPWEPGAINVCRTGTVVIVISAITTYTAATAANSVAPTVLR